MTSKAETWIEKVLLPGMRHMRDENLKKVGNADPIQRAMAKLHAGNYGVLVDHIEKQRHLWQESPVPGAGDPPQAANDHNPDDR